MEKLEGKTTIGVAQLSSLLHDCVVGLAGKDNPGVKGVEKTDNERSIVIHQKSSGNAYRRPCAGILLVLSKEQLFSLIEEGLSLGMAGYGVVLVAPAAIETRLFTEHLHPGNGTVVVAPFAHERSELALSIHNLLKALELRFLAGHGLFCQEGCPYGTADLLVLRHGQCFSLQAVDERQRLRPCYRIPLR